MVKNFGYHIFFSYSRADNVTPVNARGEGWVTALKRELIERHKAYSGRDLKIFFDKEAIVDGQDWRRRLSQGIRESRLFVAFLTPNYVDSLNCLWEWNDYLRHEHGAARGDDGIIPIYFVKPYELRANKKQNAVAWLSDLNRRNYTLTLEFHTWFTRGPQILEELNEAAQFKSNNDESLETINDTHTLAQRIEALSKHISRRLDRITLADLAPGNVSRSYEHFVGRHQELTRIHDILTEGGPKRGGRGMGGLNLIAAAQSLGGLGKTALARQYAHAYAENYAGGGTWEVGCEGSTELGSVLLKLTDDPRFRRMGEEIGKPLNLTEKQRNDHTLSTAAVLDFLKVITLARVSTLHQALFDHANRHSKKEDLPEIEKPRALIILDNVDQSDLLSIHQIAQLPAEEWLEIIVTTRLDPGKFGGGERTFTPVEVGPLPIADAVQLLQDFQPGRRFPNDTEEESARLIAHALGGYTLAVELVGAYLGRLSKHGYLPSQYLNKERFQKLK